MATLEFCDTHNMVAHLNKIEGSEDFHQIVDFLNSSHIKFALTKNPTIYTSHIQQFWQTAVVNTLDTGEVQINATIDGKVKLVSEASIRRHLKLEESDGISTLPNTEIFEQLALIGYATKSDKLTFQKGHFSPQWRCLIHTILHCLSPKKTAWEQFNSNIVTAIIFLATNRTFNFSKMIFEGMGEGSSVSVKTHHTSSGDPTTLQPPHLSPSRVPTPPYTLPFPGGHTPRSDEGKMQQTELTDLVTKLSDRVLALKNDLQQTKKVYSTTVTKLIMKVKRLEKTVKSSKAKRREKIVISDDDIVLEDSFKQERMIDDIDQDEGITLVTPTKSSTQEDQPEDRLGVLSAAKVLAEALRVHTYSRRRAVVSTGSGELDEEETQSISRDAGITLRLQEEIDAADRQRMAQRLKRKGQEVLEEYVKRQKIGEASWSGEEQSAKKEKELSEEELQELSTEPTDDKEKELWVEQKRLFEPDKDDVFQRYMHDPLKWRLYDTCGVHHVSTERGHDIFMLIEKDYPLTKGLMIVMMANKLQVDESSEMANELIRKIFIPTNSPIQ
uniref:Synaptobrevin, longin-like domain protein n=1 Tax=Tanacetum cinerariifolium TaxID=118510 RepID=A0A6L2JX84_TANCI|nr:hypothetical protein [Tanacetum cinerariifolium]